MYGEQCGECESNIKVKKVNDNISEFFAKKEWSQFRFKFIHIIDRSYINRHIVPEKMGND